MSKSNASPATVDLSERGADIDGEAQVMNRRLYMQLMVFDIEANSGPRAMATSLGRKLAEKDIPSVIYEDVNDHRGLGLLVWSEDPADLVTRIRPILGGKRFNALTPRPGWAMLGRTYSSGFESDLGAWLIDRPQENALNTDWPWAVWYPLRRNGSFQKLDAKEQGSILREHATLGRAYGESGHAHDIRLACYGLDPEDNDFVIGLVGPTLHGLSSVVQAMRGTRQTAEFIEKLGPFFVGHKVWQTPKNGYVRPEPEAASEEDTVAPEEATEEAPEAPEEVEAPAAEEPAATEQSPEEPSEDEA